MYPTRAVPALLALFAVAAASPAAQAGWYNASAGVSISHSSLQNLTSASGGVQATRDTDGSDVINCYYWGNAGQAMSGACQAFDGVRSASCITQDANLIWMMSTINSASSIAFTVNDATSQCTSLSVTQGSPYVDSHRETHDTLGIVLDGIDNLEFRIGEARDDVIQWINEWGFFVLGMLGW